MQTQSNTQYDGFYFFSILYKNKLFIIIVTVIALIVSTVIALNMQNWYSSTINLVPPRSTNSMMQGLLGSLSSTLKDIGIARLGGKTDNSYSFMVILQSRTIKDSIIKKYNLAEEYNIKNAKMQDLRLAFEENIEISLEVEGNYTLTVTDKDPQRAVAIARDYILYANNLAKRLMKSEAYNNKEYLENRILFTDERLSLIADSLEQFSRKKMIFSPEEQAKAFSLSLAELQAQRIMEEYKYNLIKKNYGENDPQTKFQKTKLTELNDQINNVVNKPGYSGNFALKDAGEVGIQYMKLYTEYETFTKVKAYLMPMLEEAKLDIIRESQSLYVVDDAVTPDRKSKPKRSLIIAGSTFGAFSLSILFLLLIHGFKNFNKRYRILVKEQNI